jgi:tRNA A-37 threonylcarbamoyl transferase component Bud32
MTSVARVDVCLQLPSDEANVSKTRLLSARLDSVAPPAVSVLPSRFRLLEKLGQGGMGVVHRAVDCELGREIAVKSLGAPRADDLYRLKREFRLLAEIRHPNVIRLYELFVEDCKACFTMDLVIGSSLYEFVHRGGRCDYRSLRVAAKQLGAALGAVHAAGKLHRDVKGSNVIVTPAGRVVLLDFGLAARVARANAKTKGAGVLLGTRGFISPEQSRGEALSVAADWYSFGVTLFEAVTGRRPCDDATLGCSAGRHAQDLGRISRLTPDVPKDLDDLVAGLLDPIARRRPDEAQVMGVLGDAPAAKTRRRSRPPPPLEANASEATVLARAVDRLERGSANVLRVYGRAGAEKSAIIERFLDEREALGTIVLRGRCRPRESVRFNALDEVVDSLSHALEHMPYSELISVLPPHVAALPRLFPVLGRLEATTDGMFKRSPENDEMTKRRGRRALRDLLKALAVRHRVVIWIDDAQWADEESRDLLRELLRPAEAPPLLVLLSYRCQDEACGDGHDALHDLHIETRTHCS